MSSEKISAQDLRDFAEGRDGPALDLYTHCLTKLIELLNPDLRRIFMNDLVAHANGTSQRSMAHTFNVFASLQRLVSEEAATLDPAPPFIEPV